MNKFFLVFLIMNFVFLPKLDAQKLSSFKSLGAAEKLWVLLHPFTAGKAYKISKKVQELSKEMADSGKLDADMAGGKIDAFRHAYWMVLLGMNIGEKKARWLGKAHEKVNRKQFEKGEFEEGFVPDKVSQEMDLHNNEIGISIARKYPEKSNAELKQIVLDLLKKGEMIIIKKDSNQNSLNAVGNIIPREEWEGKWINERVLVPSDYQAE